MSSSIDELTVIMNKKQLCSLGSINYDVECQRIKNLLSSFENSELSAHLSDSKYFQIAEKMAFVLARSYFVEKFEIFNIDYDLSNQFMDYFIDLINNNFRSNHIMHSIQFFNKNNPLLQFNGDLDDLQILQEMFGIYLIMHFQKKENIVTIYSIKLISQKAYQNVIDIIKIRYGHNVQINFEEIICDKCDQFYSGFISMINVINIKNNKKPYKTLLIDKKLLEWIYNMLSTRIISSFII